MRLRSTDVATRTIGGETIVLDLPSSQYFSVTGVGVRLVELLSAEITVEELVEAVVREYEVDAGRARRDVDAFVGRLRDARLLA